MQSRRNFLRSGIMTALSMSLAVGAGRMAFAQKRSATQAGAAVDFPVPNEARSETLFHYTQAAFESYLGSTFTAIGATGRTVELVLSKVTGYTPNAMARITINQPRETECFTLTFNASGALPTFATIHTLHHDALGEIDLFLTEEKEESGAISYQAVINHTEVPAPAIKRRGPIYRKDESPRIAGPDSMSPQ